jgi:hypothetical protein
MIKVLFTLLWLLVSGFALAGSPCNKIPGEQSHTPLKVDNGLVCFVEEPILDDNGNPVAKAISVYFVSSENKVVEVEFRGFMYDEDAGKIDDAFLLDINHDGKKEVVVIHSFQIRTSQAEPNSSGIVYSVKVFNQNKTNLKYNERASEWFGRSYSWFSDGRKTIYEYPYLSQRAIQQAANTPFAKLMMHDEIIPVIIKQKSHLYESSIGSDFTKKYLITGDKGTVDKGEAGLCRINYTGGKAPLQMWIMCDALAVDTGKQ